MWGLDLQVKKENGGCLLSIIALRFHFFTALAVRKVINSSFLTFRSYLSP